MQFHKKTLSSIASVLMMTAAIAATNASEKPNFSKTFSPIQLMPIEASMDISVDDANSCARRALSNFYESLLQHASPSGVDLELIDITVSLDRGEAYSICATGVWALPSPGTPNRAGKLIKVRLMDGGASRHAMDDHNKRDGVQN